MKAYGVIELTVSSPPQSFSEPFTIEEARTFLRIEEPILTDDAQDALLGMMISAARELAEVAQRRDLIVKQYDLNLDIFNSLLGNVGVAYPFSQRSMYDFGSFSGYAIELRHPLQSVDLVQYTDSDNITHTLTEDTDYIVDKSRGLILPPYAKMWPFFTARPSSAVMVRFSSGFTADHPFWSNAGQRVRMGMQALISSWHENRIPFEPVRHIEEYPYSVTYLLNTGELPSVR